MGLTATQALSKAKRDALSSSFGVAGMKELQDTLDLLPDAMARGVLRSATSKGMTPVSRAAKSNVRQLTSGTGTLAKSIGKKSKLYRRSGTAVTIVGPRTGYKVQVGERQNSFGQAYRTGSKTKAIYRNPTQYAHLVERGHRIRINIGGRLIDKGYQKPRPFLAPALRNNRAAVIKTFTDAVRSNIRKRIEKATKGDRGQMQAAIARLDAIERRVDA